MLNKFTKLIQWFENFSLVSTSNKPFIYLSNLTIIIKTHQGAQEIGFEKWRDLTRVSSKVENLYFDSNVAKLFED